MVNKDNIKWFNNEEESQMVKFHKTEGICEFCGSAKNICKVNIDIPNNFENVEARRQKAEFMMCDKCMDKMAKAFLKKTQ